MLLSATMLHLSLLEGQLDILTVIEG